MGGRTIAICADPIFVIGAPAAGTAEVAWALAQHSQLWTSGETDYLLYIFGDARLEHAFNTSRRAGSFLEAQSVLLPEFAEFLGHGTNALLTSHGAGKRWIEQSSSYTEMLPLVQLMFPHAQFVHVMREGRRSVNAMLSSGSPQPWGRDFREACRTWSFYVRTALAFQVAAPSRCFTIRREMLQRDPCVGMRALQSFLGVPFEDEPGDFIAAKLAEWPDQEDLTDERAWGGWTGENRAIYLEECVDALLLAADTILEASPARAIAVG